MKTFLIKCLFFSQLVASFPFFISEIEPAYVDEELENLWASFSDIYAPNYKDFLKLEHYLKEGRRPYFDSVFEHGLKAELTKTIVRSKTFWRRLHQNIKLVKSPEEPPFQKKITFGGASSDDLSRCIVLYATFNSDPQHQIPYSERLIHIIQDLEIIGFKGHVLIRVGGYPLVEKGGIKLANIPYAFKILSLIEASLLGYENVLWLDCAAHPTNNLEKVFECITRNGFYLLGNGINLDYDYNFGILPDKAILSCGLTPTDLASIPHIIATVIGVSFKNRAQHAFIQEWYRLTALVEPAMTLYPEEFLISVAAWRTGKKMSDLVGYQFDVKSFVPHKPVNSQKPFWFDKS